MRKSAPAWRRRSSRTSSPPRPRALPGPFHDLPPTAGFRRRHDLAGAGFVADGRGLSAAGPHATGRSTTSISSGPRSERTATSPSPSSRATRSPGGCLRGLKHPDDVFTYKPPKREGLPASSQETRSWIGLFKHWQTKGYPLGALGPVCYILTAAEIFDATGSAAVAAGATSFARGGRQVSADPEARQRADRRLGVLHRSCRRARDGTA